jgi:hypothetical protein
MDEIRHLAATVAKQQRGILPEIFVFKRFQSVLFGLFEFDPKMTLSVIDTINLRYPRVIATTVLFELFEFNPEITLLVIDTINLRYPKVIAAKKGTCEPVPNNLVTAN